MAREQIYMAIFVFVFGFWAVYAAIWGPHVDPRYRTRERWERSSFSEMLAAVSPEAENIFSRIVVALGGIAFIAAGIYVLVHRW
jgi:hypothetical protein